MPTTHCGEVLATERLTPSLMRVRLGGPGLDSFAMVPFTDAYVNAAFPPPGASYAAPFDPDAVRRELPPEQRPARRRYTVGEWDPERRELALDVVVHGSVGVGGPWALAARPGDRLVFAGPAGGYRPDPAADFHLMVGDESALPAIAASARAVPAGAPLAVRLLADGPEHERPIATEGALDLAWLHRSGDPAEDAQRLEAAVRALDLGAGRVHAFVHGEADETRALRRHLLADRGVARGDLSASAYWRRDYTDEAWRAVKARYTAAMERDVG